jgi:alpha-galactosidase
MTVDLRSDTLAFHFRTPQGRWDLYRLPHTGAYLEAVAMSARWRADGREHRWSGEVQDAQIDSPTRYSLAAGEYSGVRLTWRMGPPSVRFQLEMGLGVATPLLIWRVSILNEGDTPLSLGDIEMLRVGPFEPSTRRPRLPLSLRGRQPSETAPGALRVHASPGEMGFFTNGWQSWAHTGALGGDEAMPRTRLGPLTRPARENAGTRRPRAPGEHASDWYGIIGSRSGRTGLLAGFLSQREAFGSLWARLDEYAPALRLWAHGDGAEVGPGASFTTDWACVQFVDLDSEDPYGPFLETVAKMNGALISKPVPVGWCSWYQFFGQVSDRDLGDNLDWAREHRHELPLRVFQIDDGFEPRVGDWQDANAKFPGGVAHWANRVRSAGLQPGIWLAPFLAHPRARLIRSHPDWLLRTRRGLPVNAGFGWNSLARVLDVTHPQVIEFVRHLVRTATVDWGYEYLKLDFLYGGALAGKRFDPTKTRAQALYSALRAIRDEVGNETTLAGCGCPLGPGVGVFDAMRISADVAPRWHPAFFGTELFFRPEPDFPAARNAIHNIAARSPLHGRWWINDPDCLLVRAEDTHLTAAEVQTLATAIALSAGSMIDSDSLPRLDAERRAWLVRMLPPLPRPARWVDWFDSTHPSLAVLPLGGPAGDWYLIAIINWGETSRELTVGLSSLGVPVADSYHIVDFWRSAYMRLEGGQWSGDVPAHGVRFLSVRPAVGAPTWLGDTLHVSQGQAVRRWRVETSGMEIELDLGRKAEGRVWLALPRPASASSVGGRSLAWKACAAGVYAADLSFEGDTRLRVEW